MLLIFALWGLVSTPPPTCIVGFAVRCSKKQPDAPSLKTFIVPQAGQLEQNVLPSGFVSFKAA